MDAAALAASRPIFGVALRKFVISFSALLKIKLQLVHK
jgi:hypothetical protein